MLLDHLPSHPWRDISRIAFITINLTFLNDVNIYGLHIVTEVISTDKMCMINLDMINLDTATGTDPIATVKI